MVKIKSLRTPAAARGLKFARKSLPRPVEADFASELLEHMRCSVKKMRVVSKPSSRRQVKMEGLINNATVSWRWGP